MLVVLPDARAGAQLAVQRAEIVIHAAAPAERVSVIDVRNEAGKAVQAVVRLEDWERSAEGTNLWHSYGTRRGSCGTLLSVFPLTMNLAPGATQSIRLTMDSAQRLTSECWAAAVVETVQPMTVEGRSVAYVVRTAVKIYVQPNGLRADGEIVDVRVADANGSAPAPSDSSRHLEVEFENTGTRHVVTHGAVEFRRPDNSVAAKVHVPDIYVLPGARQFAKVVMPKLERGTYVVLVTLDYGGNEIAAAQIEYEVSR